VLTVIGDLIIDKYTYGSVERISPEAPVPVFKKHHHEYRLGGAANVAANVRALGEEVLLIAAVGDDEAGAIATRLLNEKGIKHVLVKVKQPTIVKERLVATPYNQQLLRIDEEQEIEANLMPYVKELSDYVLIADYNKGTVSEELIKHLNHKKLIVDTKPPKFHLYKHCFIIKPNLKELSQYFKQNIDNQDHEVGRAAQRLAQQLHTTVVVTRGERGATLAQHNSIKHFPAKRRKVFDVVGAGDTFLATLGVYLAQGHSLEYSITVANVAAGKVTEKPGTAVITQQELQQELRKTL